MEARLSPQPVAPASRAELIDAAIDRALKENRIVGAVVLVAERGERVYQRAAGLADREAGRPVRLDTPFRFASVTKPFTVMTAMKLIEQGRLSPDDPVSRHLPEFRPGLADGAAAQITVAHLMEHTAGLDYRFNQPSGGLYERAGISDGIDEAHGTLAENVARISSVPLAFAPGSRWQYSVGTDVLGAVIEAVSGLPLDRAVATLVCEPLGLDARFHWDGDDLAVPYHDAVPVPARMTGAIDVPLAYIDGPGIRFDPDRIRSAKAWPSGGAGMAGRAQDVLTLLEAFRTGTFLGADLREDVRLSLIHI